MPEHVKNAQLVRKFQGVTYNINVINKKNDGAVSIVVTNGKADVDGTIVKAQAGQKEVSLEVTVG